MRKNSRRNGACSQNYFYGGPQLSRQKQIVSPQKQICYGKSKLEMAKANLLRQKQIGNGNSQLVKVESKFVTAKANSVYTEEVPNS